MRVHRYITWTATLLAVSLPSWPAFSQETDHYTRFRDAKWYARQIQSLRDEVAKIDADLKTLVEARKSGKGITDAVALDQEPEGVTSEGQMEVLRKRRVVLLRQIDALEEQGRNKPSELVRISTRLTEKQAEAKEAEQKVAELEGRLTDLRWNSPTESAPEGDAAAESESVNSENDRDQKDEAYWRK